MQDRILKYSATTPARLGPATAWTLRLPIVEAGRDAIRAARIAPRWHAFVENRRARSWRWYEIVVFKALMGVRTFVHSFALRRARVVVVPRLPTEGLLANLLHVIEVLHRVEGSSATT